MAKQNIEIKENRTWKNVKRSFKVNEKWNSTRSELKANRIWSDIRSGMDSYAHGTRRVWDELKAEQERRKGRAARSYLLEEV